VVEACRLPLDKDTLAFIVISTPAMFDQTFKPFILRQECIGDRACDLIDRCIAEQFSLLKQVFFLSLT